MADAIDRWVAKFDQPISHPSHCDLCGNELDELVYDGKVHGISAWAYMCPRCFNTEFGGGLFTRMVRVAKGPWKVQRKS